MLSLLALCGLAGCEAEVSSGAAMDAMEVTVALSGNHVNVASMALAHSAPAAPADPRRDLRWELRDPERGEVVASGAVPDPREARDETFGESPDAPDAVRASIGTIALRLPNTAGELYVLEPVPGSGGSAYREIGHDHVFAMEPGRTSVAVLDDSRDVLGAPVAIVNHGTDRTQFNILVVPDGYTEAELARFHTDAQRLVAGLSAVPGYAEHWNQFNVWIQDVRSRDSGTEDPEAGGAPLDTAFELAFGDAASGRVHRCVLPSGPSQPTVVAWLDRARRTLNADAVVILANSDTYGGCALPAARVVTATRNPEGLRIVAHELGHGLFGLQDEYDVGGYACDTSVNGPNVTNDPMNPPWADLVDAAVLPTPVMGTAAGTVGAFEGARWCAAGLYRPTASCMMRDLRAPLCPVCKRVIERQLAARSVDVEHATEGVVGVAVRVQNRTGAALFARCDGGAAAACSGWLLVNDGASVTVRTPDRRIVIDNSTVQRTPVDFVSVRLRAPADAVTLYANETNPLTAP